MSRDQIYGSKNIKLNPRGVRHTQTTSTARIKSSLTGCLLVVLALLTDATMAASGNYQDSSPLTVKSADPVTIRQSGNNITLSNEYLERTLTTEGSCLRTSGFTNRLSHQTYSLSGPEFQIELIDEEMAAVNPVKLTTQDFNIVDRAIDEEPDGGRKITFQLQAHQRNSKQIALEYDGRVNLRLDVSYELRPGDNYTRQSIKVTKSTEGNDFIHYLAVFKDKWESITSFDLGGLGQPLFGPDVFMGLEYPSGINEVTGSEASLGSYVGLEISKEGFASASAVLGVSLPGRVHDAFMTYTDRIRALPPRPYVEYNNFYDVPGTKQNAQNTLELIAELDAHLLKPYSLHLDTFTLDDSWDDPEKLWAIDESRFPNGFRDIENALARLESNLGLWLGPHGGYGPDPDEDAPIIDFRDRAAAGKRIGLEVNSDGRLDIAGQAYSHYLQRTIVGLITTYHVNYFKFDGITLACNQLGHGHAVGIYSREAAVRNVIALTQAMRKANPGVFIDLSSGPWLSPWWLLYGDSVDYGGMDYSHVDTIPSPTPRQSAISYRDSVHYQEVNAARAQFPISSLSSTGIIKNRDLLRGEEESLDDWSDEVVNYVGAGIMFADLMLSPTRHSHDLLTSEEWKVVGRTLQYMVRNRHPLLDNGTLVLGNPAHGEPYGYVHYSAQKTIIMLRNPSVRPASARLSLTDENGFEPTQAPFWADMIYPFRESLSGVFTYGSTLEVPLDGYEQRVLELTPVQEDMARIEGIRFSQLPAGDGKINYTIYAAKDSEAMVNLPNSLLYSGALVDGSKTKMQVAKDKDQQAMPIRFGTTAARESQPTCQSSPVQTDDRPGRVGPRHLLYVSLSCLISSDFQESEIAVLLESGGELGDIEGDVTLDGSPAPIVAERNKLWYWGTTTLTAGRHAVEFKLHFPSGMPSNVQVSGWFKGRRLLMAKQLHLALRPGTKLRPSDEDLLPSSSQVERKTYPLFDQQIR